MGQHSSLSVHTHPKGDADLDYLQEQDRQGLLVKSTDSKATFDLSMADHTDYYYLDDNVLKIFIDKKAIMGTETIGKKEIKHIKKQIKDIGNLIKFDIKVVKKIGEADVGMAKFNNMLDDLGEDSVGTWDPANNFDLRLPSVCWEDTIIKNDKKLAKFDTKTTISHEIGHIFGLEHPLTDFFDDHPKTIMGGNELIEQDGPFLTKQDLNLIALGWDVYESNPNIYG